jgi:[ribosomal protein S5]-alanine N-acetyltransferase
MLQGKKINLRLMKMEDLEQYVDNYNNLAERGYYYPQNLLSIEKYKRDMAENNCWSNDWGNLQIVTKDNKILGTIAFFKPSDYQTGLEIGYKIDKKENRGKGYGSEALLLFSAYLFALKPINRIEINAAKDNIASYRIAEKCGFQYEGTMRKAVFFSGEEHDLVKYSLLKAECPLLKDLIQNE